MIIWESRKEKLSLIDDQINKYLKFPELETIMLDNLYEFFLVVGAHLELSGF